jgi:putative ABC transport system ATP-binding protein
MIKTEKLTKVFRTDEVETTALHQIDLEIKPGEFAAIMGPSGCGKSTLLNILGLLDNPSTGKYYFLNHEVSHYSERQRSRFRKENIGFVFQNFNLIDELSVFANVELPLVYQGVSPAERRKKVTRVLEQMAIDHRSKHYPLQLSGGQQQRVAVARALVTNPALILADEPTGNLDSVHGTEVMELLKDLNNKGTTIIMVTHSQRDAEYAGRVIRLLDGQVVTENLKQIKKPEPAEVLV